MNWEAIGAVGETVGALAVLLTLVYLAMQIRQNTRSVQAAAVWYALQHTARFHMCRQDHTLIFFYQLSLYCVWTNVFCVCSFV